MIELGIWELSKRHDGKFNLWSLVWINQDGLWTKHWVIQEVIKG